MTEQRTARQAMQKLADDISAGVWKNLHLLYAEDAVVRHPLARDQSSLLQGRESLEKHFERFFASGVQLVATPIHFMETSDPQVVIGLFAYHGHNGFGLESFELEACFIWRVSGGLVVDTTDYLSQPLAPRS